MSAAVLVLTAHGSADPRAAVNTNAVADEIRRHRPGLDVRVAFCEQSTPNLRDVVADTPGADCYAAAARRRVSRTG